MIALVEVNPRSGRPTSNVLTSDPKVSLEDKADSGAIAVGIVSTLNFIEVG